MNGEARNKILSAAEIKAKIDRIAHEINESCYLEEKLILVGISGRGYDFAKRLHKELNVIAKFKLEILQINLDKDNPIENEIQLKQRETIKNTAVILIDDVLNSGKTLAYAAAFFIAARSKNAKNSNFSKPRASPLPNYG